METLREMEAVKMKPRFSLTGSPSSSPTALLRSPVLSPMEEHIIYQQDDLFLQGFPLMEEIRRQGKLCDVTLKVLQNPTIHWVGFLLITF